MTTTETGTTEEALTMCLDVGTSSVKAVLLDRTGETVATATRPTNLLRPTADRSEQDMDEVLAAAAAACSEAANTHASQVSSLAVTAQGDGCWLVDNHARPVGPAILWNDSRARDIADQWNADGTAAALFAINGAMTFPGMAHTILAHLAATEPDRVQTAAAALTCGGWMHAALTGRIAVDTSEAAAPWLDASTGDWSEDIVRLTGLGDLASLRPQLLHDDDRHAPLLGTAAATFGLPAGIPVVYAPYDVVTGALGVGATEPGLISCVLGTTLSVAVGTDDPTPTGTPTGLTLPSGAPGLTLRVFPTQCGCELIDWATALLGLNDPADLTDLAADSVPGAQGVVCLPYFSPAGERAPFLDTTATGSLTGMTSTTSRSDIARAVLEGLAHTISECIDLAGTGHTEIRLTGGGAASDLWCQIIADVTGTPTAPIAGDQGSARGAWVAARTALGDTPAPPVTARTRFAPAANSAPAHRAVRTELAATRTALAPRWAPTRALNTPPEPDRTSSPSNSKEATGG